MTRIPLTLAVLCLLVALAAGQSHRLCQVRDPSSCPRGEYCALAFGLCGDLSGTCEDVPTQCGDIYVPVCGCDGRTYGNHCKARQHAISVRSVGECPSGPQEPCPELRELCNQLEERVNLYASELYANDGLGAPLFYAQVNWTAVEQYIAVNNFRVEDYSLFSSAGIYTNIRTYWRALNTANSLFPLVEASVDWTTCDPFARRVVSQHREVYGRARWGGPIEKETSTSLYVFEFEPNGLRLTSHAFWTSANLADLVRDDNSQR